MQISYERSFSLELVDDFFFVNFEHLERFDFKTQI